MSVTAVEPQRTALTDKRPVAQRLAPAGTVRSILFPSDLSPASDRAFEHARLLAETTGARLTLFHVAQGPPPRGDSVEDEVWRRSARAAHERLVRQSSDLRVPSEVVIARGIDVEAALSARIAQGDTDLTVMATHGRAALAHLVLGSVAESVVRHTRRPVLCVREPEHGAAAAYRRILVPTDLSPASARALRLSAFLARTFGAEVLALHVAAVTAARGLLGVSYAAEAAPTETDLLRFLGPAFVGIRVRAQVLFGSVEERIADTARSEHVDLVVVTTHGHDSLSDRLGGSHADRLIRQAPCPILVV
jgi:nucleotide-binding universal stress UspA family protein